MEGIDPVKSWQPAKARCHIQPKKGKDKSENFEHFYLEANILVLYYISFFLKNNQKLF